MLEERTIHVLAYNLEMVLAEKLETIVSRGDQNTRPRDFYDIYILCKLQSKNKNIEQLQKAMSVTSEKRGSSTILTKYRSIMEAIQKSEMKQNHWKRYQKDFDYAKDITFGDTCAAVGK